MKKLGKSIAVALGLAASVFCVAAGCIGCSSTNLSTIRFNLILEQLEMAVIGNDAYSWNVICVDPENSFGYVRQSEPTWYSYNPISSSDISDASYAFDMMCEEIESISINKLSASDAAKYRSVEFFLRSYAEFYGSPYAYAFSLLSGDYISAEGGYVADFASCFENYAFRNERDVQDLLKITQSTDEAFATYANFAAVRENAKYPLYDYTITGMQDYLNAITEKGDEYYLYEFSDHKIDKADFLTDAQKQQYKKSYADALTDDFMKGVSDLSSSIEKYKGKYATLDKSCIAAYGNAGKAYYEWLLYSKTGIEGVTVDTVYNQILTAYYKYNEQYNNVRSTINGLEQSDPELYAGIQSYIKGDKAIMDLGTPAEMMDYLKTAATAIVPDLQTMPEIDFKEMDETVAEISSTNAYYLQSPVDDPNAVEHVTINPRLKDSDPGDLLFTIAHEGYPGHLYASVNAKENGFRIMGRVSSCISFSEGWANYAAVTVFRNLAESADDRALELYCEYKYLEQIRGYLNTQLFEFQINYFGASVNDLVGERKDYESDEAYAEAQDEMRDVIGSLMGMPAVYIPYSYGLYVMLDIHDAAMDALGSGYSETALNGMLLSEGTGPTLTRAYELANAYMISAR